MAIILNYQTKKLYHLLLINALFLGWINVPFSNEMDKSEPICEVEGCHVHGIRVNSSGNQPSCISGKKKHHKNLPLYKQVGQLPMCYYIHIHVYI